MNTRLVISLSLFFFILSFPRQTLSRWTVDRGGGGIYPLNGNGYVNAPRLKLGNYHMERCAHTYAYPDPGYVRNNEIFFSANYHVK